VVDFKLEKVEMFKSRNLRKIVVAGLAVSCALAGTTASAQIKKVKGIYVNRIVLNDNDFGGCAIRVSSDQAGANVMSPADLGLDTNKCSNNFLTFDCNGSAEDGSGNLVSNKTIANAKLTAAQLAYVTRESLFMSIDQSVDVNGSCWVRQFTIRKDP